MSAVITRCRIGINTAAPPNTARTVAGVDYSTRETNAASMHWGHTDSERHLFVAFTIREDFIRVISARDMTAREVRRYTG